MWASAESPGDTHWTDWTRATLSGLALQMVGFSLGTDKALRDFGKKNNGRGRKRVRGTIQLRQAKKDKQYYSSLFSITSAHAAPPACPPSQLRSTALCNRSWPQTPGEGMSPLGSHTPRGAPGSRGRARRCEHTSPKAPPALGIASPRPDAVPACP